MIKFKYWILIILCIFGVFISHQLYYMSHPVQTIEISAGEVGDFVIGDTKEKILASHQNKVFSPRPKPIVCPTNWINISEMDKTQKQCLLSSSEWREGHPSTRYLCKQSRMDVNSKLFFNDNILSKVIIECWNPK